MLGLDRIVRFKSINETARCELMSQPSPHMKFEYDSSFYGECTLHLPLEGTDFGHLNVESATVEACVSKRGTERALTEAAKRCLSLILVKHADQRHTSLSIPKRGIFSILQPTHNVP